MTTNTHPPLGGRAALALMSCLMIALYAPTVAWLLDRWTLSVWHHVHGLLLIPVVGYLVRKELQECRDLPVESSPLGFFILIPALVLHALDAGIHSQLLAAAAMFLALPGLSLLFLGKERTKAIFFLLMFLFFTLPIPLSFTEEIHLALRKIAVFGSSHLIPLFGIPLYVSGTTLQLPQGDVMVADACSGFSTLYATLAMACLIAYRCTAPRRRILILLLAAPVAILANVIRVCILVLMVAWQGIDILGTPLHSISGMLVFVLALLVIIRVGWEPHQPAEGRP